MRKARRINQHNSSMEKELECVHISTLSDCNLTQVYKAVVHSLLHSLLMLVTDF